MQIKKTIYVNASTSNQLSSHIAHITLFMMHVPFFWLKTTNLVLKKINMFWVKNSNINLPSTYMYYVGTYLYEKHFVLHNMQNKYIYILFTYKLTTILLLAVTREADQTRKIITTSVFMYKL
jgi:hypothetical protein